MTDTPKVPTPTTQPPRGRRLGRIDIHANVLENFPLATAMFKALGFVPWDVRFNQATDLFSMLGTSPLFRLIEEGAAAPYYTVQGRENPVEGGVELVVTVLEQERSVLDIVEPLTKDSKVVGGEQ